MQDCRQLFQLTGKIAVVLGASSGIGQASAHALGQLGTHWVCADRDGAGAQATAEQMAGGGGSAEHRVVDAASGAAIAAPCGAQHSHAWPCRCGRVHADADHPQADPRLHRRRIRPGHEPEHERCVPRSARVWPADAAAPQRRSGSLILCSSMRAVTLEPGLGIYAASKASIAQLVKGFVAEVGAAVAFLASDAASDVTGSSLSVDGGWTAIDGPQTGLTQMRPSE